MLGRYSCDESSPTRFRCLNSGRVVCAIRIKSSTATSVVAAPSQTDSAQAFDAAIPIHHCQHRYQSIISGLVWQNTGMPFHHLVLDICQQ